MKILVTGTAGFIGYHLAERLAERGDEVVGIDNLNEYYDIRLKYARLAESGVAPAAAEIHNTITTSRKYPNYRFVRMDLERRDDLFELCRRERFDAVCNLAAQAGVRHSLTNPYSYVDANVAGFLNVLEACRAYNVGNLTYASTSSVYGLNAGMPFSTSDNVDHPVSLYAATKKANELMAHTYSYLYGIPTTGLRFFTVYGPWGRPDMALFLFTRAILAGRPIQVFNHGRMKRDFTYIDDIVEGILRVIDNPEEPTDGPPDPGLLQSLEELDPSWSPAPYRVYNIGHGAPVSLLEFIEVLEAELGLPAEREYLPMQPGDVAATWADVTPLELEFGYKPKIEIAEGIHRFVRWYRTYGTQIFGRS